MKFTFAPIENRNRFDRVSPSSLATLAQCPRSYAIHRDHALAKKAHKDINDDPPNYKMRFGTIFHKAVEKPDEDIDELVAKECAVLGESAWDSFYKSPDDIAVAIKKCVAYFRKHEVSKPWRKRTKKTLIEQELKSEINGMKIKGVVDMITNKGEVVDLKTTSKSWPQWHGLQLGAYWLLAKLNGVKVQDEASVIKIYRPRGPKGGTGIDEERIDASKQETQINRLMEKAVWLRDNQATWETDYTKIESNPNANRCGLCCAKGTSACPETRIW